ncbi:transcription termination factor MTERF6, chloroplastic/mitochondrial-like [Gossypium arboreum]|uniref:transcription termination factor MTERF6, chloroplastic/mitochondrial-like n=1 Tax=Gossypium arboreum TaxID=29729 RepID=UPI0022F154C3|nr:transcription termination factor MTERF6, chloroplastic/mitochondrial-like [Gossypium arboreum]
MLNSFTKNIIDFFKLLHIVTNNSFSNNPSLFFTVRRISNKTKSQNPQSFTVSYLRTKLGFPPESALRISKYVHFKTPEKPDSVIAFLEQHGFSDTQIRQIILTRPALLCSDVEKTFLPKFQFFQSKGVTGPEISKLLVYNPRILSRSLEKRIIPCFNQLSKLLQSDSKAITALRRNPYLMEIVKDVKEMGFNPLLVKFLHAVILFRKVSKPAMESKFDVYKKWGWSDDEIWEAFRRYPGVLEASKEKITAIMDFLVNEMGFQSLILANHPSVISRSLEKRIVPRALFARELLSKGLIKDLKFSVVFGTSEKVFVQRFVNQYKDKAPELLKLYEEKLKFAVRGKYKSN